MLQVKFPRQQSLRWGQGLDLMPERLLGGFWGPILVKRKEQQLEGAEGEVEM